MSSKSNALDFFLQDCLQEPFKKKNKYLDKGNPNSCMRLKSLFWDAWRKKPETSGKVWVS